MTLIAEGLCFSYRSGPPILSGVGFSVEGGQVACLLGPNGAGKTTLIRCVVGLARPTGGTVLVEGEAIADMGAATRARRVAYVPQSADIPFEFSVLDVVATGRSAYVNFARTPSKRDWAVSVDALATVGVDHLARRSFNHISGGERQLVTIARALAQHAPVVVLDEPTSALDYGNQVRVLGIIRELASAGKAVLMASHAPNQALESADRVLMLKDGKLAAYGRPDEVISGSALTDLYGVPIDVVAVETRSVSRRVCVPNIDLHVTTTIPRRGELDES